MRTFHVSVPQEDAEIAADRLWQLGVEAVGVDDPVGGRVELWTSVGESPHSLERAVAALDEGWEWRTEAVVEPADTWRDHVQPTWYDETGVIVPAWQAAQLDVGPDVLVTVIEPASSFGLGDHPTTTTSLALLSAHLRDSRLRRAGVDRVLDVGCGSGVLGIVAAQRGVRTVRSIDISSAAVEATVDNARRNGVDDRIEADISPVSAIEGVHDVVLANILAPTLVSMAADLRRVTAPNGVLVISGILEDAHDHVVAALSPLHPVASKTKDGWISIVLRR